MRVNGWSLLNCSYWNNQHLYCDLSYVCGVFCSASSFDNMEHVFEVGKEVEARFNEIGYRGAWFRCKVYSMSSSLCFLDHRLESLSLLHQCAMRSHFKSSFVCNMWQILESRRSGEEWEYLLYYLDFTEESKYMACSLLAFLCICRFCSQGKGCKPNVFNRSEMQGGTYSIGRVLSHSSSNKHQRFSVYSTVVLFGVMLFGE